MNFPPSFGLGTGLALLLPASLLLASLQAAAEDQQTSPAASVKIEEWLVPWPNTRPRDPYLAPDGTVWFVGQSGDYAAQFNPEDTSFQRFEMEAGTGPHNLIVDDQGIVWFAGNRNAYIGRLDPATGAIEKTATPATTAKDPHTLHFDEHGGLWFTAQWGNAIGHLTPHEGAQPSIRMSALSQARSRPYGIDLDSHGNAWVALLGTNGLAMVNPTDFSLHELLLPRSQARPRRIAVTADDKVWYVDYPEGYLGYYDPHADRIREWRAPGAEKSGPYALGADSKGRLWFVETFQQPNRLVGFDPASEAFFSQTIIPSGGGAVRHMYYDAASNSLWFGTDTNYLARAQLPE